MAKTSDELYEVILKIMERVRVVVAEECGIPVEEMKPGADCDAHESTYLPRMVMFMQLEETTEYRRRTPTQDWEGHVYAGNAEMVGVTVEELPHFVMHMMGTMEEAPFTFVKLPIMMKDPMADMDFPETG